MGEARPLFTLAAGFTSLGVHATFNGLLYISAVSQHARLTALAACLGMVEYGVAIAACARLIQHDREWVAEAM